MSFSSSAKDEIAAQRTSSAAQRLSMLAGLTNTAGSITIGRSGTGVRYITETYSVGKLVSRLACAIYDVDAAIAVREKEGMGTRSVSIVLSGAECETLLKDTGLLVASGEGMMLGSGIRPNLISSETKKRAFLSGAFLGSGSITNPDKSYHLEIVCRNEELAKKICEMMNGFGFNAKSFQRKSTSVVYVKEGDSISGFLALMGASNAALEFEEARIYKSIKNNTNRMVNYENANLDKTARAAAAQTQCIELIRDVMGLTKLPDALREVAEVRLNNREATLNELAQLTGISKSSVNYRLGKLKEIADDIRHKYGDV